MLCCEKQKQKQKTKNKKLRLLCYTTASNNIKSFEAQANASITNATLRIIIIKY
jgi:hypothetical protein